MVFPIAVIVVTCYLLGNLNGSVCISTLVAHDDVRNHGSGNAGLTNFIRNYGIQSGLLVMLIDVLKAACACFLGGLILKPFGYYQEGLMLGAISVSIGHDFPALLGFKGGKGILSGCVVAFVIDWRIGLILLAIFGLVYGLTKYVSLASVLGALAFGVGFVLLHHTNTLVMLGGIFMSGLAIFMHRGNIARLLKGQERKTDLFGKKGKQL